MQHMTSALQRRPSRNENLENKVHSHSSKLATDRSERKHSHRNGQKSFKSKDVKGGAPRKISAANEDRPLQVIENVMHTFEVFNENVKSAASKNNEPINLDIIANQQSIHASPDIESPQKFIMEPEITAYLEKNPLELQDPMQMIAVNEVNESSLETPTMIHMSESTRAMSKERANQRRIEIQDKESELEKIAAEITRNRLERSKKMNIEPKPLAVNPVRDAEIETQEAELARTAREIAEARQQRSSRRQHEPIELEVSDRQSEIIVQHPTREDRREILNKIMTMVLDSQDIINTPVEELQSQLNEAIQKQMNEWGDQTTEMPALETLSADYYKEDISTDSHKQLVENLQNQVRDSPYCTVKNQKGEFTFQRSGGKKLYQSNKVESSVRHLTVPDDMVVVQQQRSQSRCDDTNVSITDSQQSKSRTADLFKPILSRKRPPSTHSNSKRQPAKPTSCSRSSVQEPAFLARDRTPDAMQATANRDYLGSTISLSQYTNAMAPQKMARSSSGTKLLNYQRKTVKSTTPDKLCTTAQSKTQSSALRQSVQSTAQKKERFFNQTQSVTPSRTTTPIKQYKKETQADKSPQFKGQTPKRVTQSKEQCVTPSARDMVRKGYTPKPVSQQMKSAKKVGKPQALITVQQAEAQPSPVAVKKRKQSSDQVSAKTFNAPLQLNKQQQCLMQTIDNGCQDLDDLWPREGQKLDEHLLIKKRKKLEAKVAYLQNQSEKAPRHQQSSSKSVGKIFKEARTVMQKVDKSQQGLTTHQKSPSINHNPSNKWI